MNSLNGFINDLDQMYLNGSVALANGAAQIDDTFVLDSNKRMLDIVTNHMAANSYAPGVQQHFNDLKAGLEKAVQIQAEWIAKGLSRDTAPAQEVKDMDAASMQLTYAETQLRIAAGR